MDVCESIKNIRAKCNNYVDPDLVSTIIDDNGYMGTNNILEITGYGISDCDSYEERFIKILNSENIFISCGMLAFIPMLNECDIFSIVDEAIKITQEEFDENAEEKEVFFGILIEKNTTKYTIGIIDLCNCKVGSCFREIKKSENGFYKKIAEIIDEMIIS
jgi:hypothetical protein